MVQPTAHGPAPAHPQFADRIGFPLLHGIHLLSIHLLQRSDGVLGGGQVGPQVACCRLSCCALRPLCFDSGGGCLELLLGLHVLGGGRHVDNLNTKGEGAAAGGMQQPRVLCQSDLRLHLDREPWRPV